ncbi:MAG: MarR family transcriptional regulator [Firmicutes bacterium]|nr:MarR family transcriptional regulator [Bacillota bacterium]MBQ7058114.1 MarR family transcriptional regulator [Bacillota bacterium]
MAKGKKDSELELLQMNLIGKIFLVSKEHRIAINRYVEQNALQKSQHRLLLTLSHLIGERQNVSQRDLAESLNVTPAAVAVTLKKLEKNGIVTKTASEADNRYNELTITEKGEQIVKDSKKAFHNTDMLMFRDFSREELEQLGEYLDRIADNLLSVTEEKE